jgi:hypothetical protein
VSDEPGEEKPKKRKGLLAFYIAAFVLLGLFAGGVLAWPRVAAWRRERATVQLFLNSLDSRINVNFKDAPSEEVLNFCKGVMEVGVVGRYEDLPDLGTKKVTMRYEDVPIGFVLDGWCRQVGAAWTVADAGCGKHDGPNFKLCLGSPKHVRKLEEANPVAARMVRSYREGLKRFKPAESLKK